MRCYDCALDGWQRDAVAVCADCGAGTCVEHCHVEARWLTRTAVINRVETVNPPGRVIRCSVCAAAHHALGSSATVHQPQLAGAHQ